jgi:predicted Zn-dependent protease
MPRTTASASIWPRRQARRKDYAGAARQYRILLEAQPENPAVLNNWPGLPAQLKDPKAIEYAEKANKLAPDQPALMDTLAVC